MTKKLAKKISKRTAAVILLVALMLSSIGFSFLTAKPEFHRATIEILDEKKMDAIVLSTTATAVATAVSALGKDAGEPIANMLTDITEYVVMITAVVFFEKFLLTTISSLTFAFLIPLACVLFIVFIYTKKETFKNFAFKIALFGIVLTLVVPVSTYVGVAIEKTHKESFDVEETVIVDENGEVDKSFKEKLKGKTEEVMQFIEDKINYFIDSIAVMIITTCAIPIAVLWFMLWFIKMLFGVDIKPPKVGKIGRKIKNKVKKSKEDSEDTSSVPVG